MTETLAASITKAASTQTFYTIRFLVDRDRIEDAYRAYGYFRWVDDVLDTDSGTPAKRMIFLERQRSLLDSCYRGRLPRDLDLQEKMLLELVQHDPEKNSGLHSYLRHMMLVMEFDAGRRGRLISQAELNDYTRWLAIAVTEAMHYFIGHGDFAPRDEARYLAVSAAHIIHMLRDTVEDVQSGYFNIPREVLDANAMGPGDVTHNAYRAWVRGRIDLAREYFQEGKGYFGRMRNRRHRLAGMAYIARFEWLLDTIEREGYLLRPEYSERKSLGTGLHMGWMTLASLISVRGTGKLSQPVIAHPLGKS